jgi:hypothetical protein
MLLPLPLTFNPLFRALHPIPRLQLAVHTAYRTISLCLTLERLRKRS